MSLFESRLRNTRALRFTATSALAPQIQRVGVGEVVVEHGETPLQFTFRESGYWHSIIDGVAQAARVRFSNVYRWTLCANTDAIRLEHLRRGEADPQTLLEFPWAEMNQADRCVNARDAHICAQDRYNATLSSRANILQLHWRIEGPHKRESLQCEYAQHVAFL